MSWKGKELKRLQYSINYDAPKRGKPYNELRRKSQNTKSVSAMWVLIEEFTRKFRFKHAQITSSMVNGKAGGEKWKSLTEQKRKKSSHVNHI